MRDPRWIGTTFGTFLHLIKAAKFSGTALAPSATIILLSAVVLWQPKPDAPASLNTLSEVRLPLATAMASAVTAAPAATPALTVAAAPVQTVAKVEARPVEPTPVATLTEKRNVPAAAAPVRVASTNGSRMELEQHNLAAFIATRYRVAFDNTQLFVDGAYRAARDNKLDPWLILAVMAVESSFDPSAVSSKGAHGLMQVLTRVHAEKYAPFGGVTAAFDPIANIKVGARILREYIARDGTVEGGLKAYVGAALMPSDGGYGSKVMAERDRLAAIATGKRQPPPSGAVAKADQPGDTSFKLQSAPAGAGNPTKLARNSAGQTAD